MSYNTARSFLFVIVVIDADIDILSNVAIAGSSCSTSFDLRQGGDVSELCGPAIVASRSRVE